MGANGAARDGEGVTRLAGARGSRGWVLLRHPYYGGAAGFCARVRHLIICKACMWNQLHLCEC